MNLAKLTNSELLDRYQKLSGKIPCYHIQNDEDRKWHITFIRGKDMNKYHITNEQDEDTFNSTDDLEEAISMAKSSLSRVGDLANVEEKGKVIKQFTLNKNGSIEEVPIVEDYTITWKKATKIQIGRVNKVFEKFNQLVGYLNDYPGIRIAYIETPKLTLGQHTYDPITLDVYLRFDSEGAWIPKKKRNDLIVLVGLLSEKYDILEWKIGFESQIKLPSHISPSLSVDTNKSLSQTSPILKMTLAIEEPQYPEIK